MSGISPKTFEFGEQDQPLEAGQYLVVDPCYVIGGDPFWDHLCKYSFPPDLPSRDQFYLKLDNEYVCYVFDTRYGDGHYPVNDETTYGGIGVDAGILSLIPMPYINKHDLDYGPGVIVTLRHDSIPVNDSGNVICGNITITTGELDYEDEYEDEEDEEEEEYDNES